jgi:hypothetical protein
MRANEQKCEETEMAERKLQGNVAALQRDWGRDLVRAEQRGRMIATEHPVLALGLALLGGYCLGRALARA